MTKKKLGKHIKQVAISVAVLILALPAVFLVPRILSLTDQRIMISTQESGGNSFVAGVEKTPSVQINSGGITPPNFTASSILAEDFDSGNILYQKDIHHRLLPASTTKLMSALVAVDHYRLADTLTVYPEDLVGGSVMGLTSGEKISFRSLLYGMLLNSGNDAAYTLASNYPGGLDSFVSAMNNKAQGLGLTDTHFQNPAGFDDPAQYSSAYDLAKIALTASNDSEISKITSTKEATVYSLDSNKEHLLFNLNKLLGIGGVIGIKTGTTEQAGENLIGLVERGGHRVLTVMLDSQDRFNETKTLMDWVYRNFSWSVK